MILGIIIGFLVVAWYILDKRLLSYWSRHGFKQLNPRFLVGDVARVLMLKESLGSLAEQIYLKCKKDNKLVGIYMTYNRALVICDPLMVQHILIRDFSSFTDRPMPHDTDADPLNGHLFNLPGQRWRDLRVKLTPTFTSGKLKMMFPVIKDCTKVLEDYMLINVKNGIDVFDTRDLMARYNTNIISSVAFGIANDCINNPHHIFRLKGASVFAPTMRNAVNGLIIFLGFSEWLHRFKIKLGTQDVEDFIFETVIKTIEDREKDNVTRKDFMQLLIELKNNGYVAADKGEPKAKANEIKKDGATIRKMTMAEVAAQVFVFFIAGFETTSSTLSYCLYEMARDKKLQKKTQREIDKVLRTAGCDGVTYDLLSKMKYVECCIDETLRKYPAVHFLLRSAVKDYKVENTECTVPKGTQIIIPLMGLHRDPEIFENPLEFKPERFLNSNVGGGKSPGSFYLPFGAGPRTCIASRMGKLTTKIALVSILSKFNLKLADKVLEDELEFQAAAYVLIPKHKLNIKFSTRSSKKKH